AKIVKMTSEDIDKLMAFPNIVHNRKKLEAIVNQAKGYFKIEQDYCSFSKFLWSYVDHKPLVLGYIQSCERITVDQITNELSKKLKHYEFSLLGSVTVFSFLDAS